MKKNILMTVCLLAGMTVTAQDSASSKTLDSILVNSFYLRPLSLPEISGTKIYAGKHTNQINFTDGYDGLSQNLGRTALSKIPGLTMWEMDGAGTQLNIGSRGTDPHRSIEMNMRQNGYNTNSDLFGYPENHFSIPLQAVANVELVRGSAALQFGPQFGGMMNYELKKGDSTKSFSVESEQTAGSNNYFNSYNAAGGTTGRFNYYTFADLRHGDGWRKNAAFNYQSFYLDINYQATAKMNIGLQFSRMKYVQQIAGGLTDVQFRENPRQSFRSRNYFQPIINIPALLLKSDLSSDTKLDITAHGILGERSSVQFINAGNIPDTFNTSIGSFNPRQVDRDYYDGFAIEARVLHHYKMKKIAGTLSGGLRFFSEATKRRQKGTGSTGSDFDLSLAKHYGIDLHLSTVNYALFAENEFRLTPAFSFTPGFRYVVINSKLNGVINDATAVVSYRSKRNFPLFGAGLQYQLNKTMQVYGNITQAYRPYLYANITPADRLDKIDPNLQDSKGYDIDFGFRGSYKNIFRFDLDLFYLWYGKKIGLLSETTSSGASHLLTSNIGNSATKGIEVYTELSWIRLINPANSKQDLRWFTSLALNHATFIDGMLTRNGVNTSVKGKYVENAPVWNLKSGLELIRKNFSSTIQYSYTSKCYNDAFNTISSANSVLGEIPSYHVLDWFAKWEFAGRYKISAGINNFTNERFFNRRITFYPGPGILPADGRTMTVSFGIHI